MRKELHKSKNVLLSVIGYTLFVVLLVAVTATSAMQHVNSFALDGLRTKDISHDAVVVAIDDATLQELGAWPLERALYASFIERLNGHTVKGLVFDVLFLEDKEGDSEVKKALSQATYPVIFGSKITDTGTLHSVFLESSTTDEGFVNVTPDRDGKVRSFARGVEDGSECQLPLSFRLLTIADRTPGCASLPDGRFVYPNTVPVFSFSDVLHGKVSGDLLKDKVIFVGATTLDLEDYFIGLEGVKIPGVLVHTGMYSSYKNKMVTQPLSKEWSSVLVALAAVLGSLIVVYFKRPLVQIGTLVILTVSGIVGTVIAFDFFVEIPLISLIVGAIASFTLTTLVYYAKFKKENAFIRTMFSRYVNKDVLQKLLHSNSGYKESEKRYITVFFSDLRGFTDFSETLEPEELTELLNDYFARMVSEIFKQNGTVDKFIGDAVMAFWNAPLPIENHELCAIKAAIGTQEALEKFNKEHGAALKMGIGIHSGFAVVGNIGGSERISYTALGDSVNTTSRIEGITKKYGVNILISGEVVGAIKKVDIPGWRLRKVDEVLLKGKQKSVLLYEVTQLKEDVVTLYEKALSLYQSSSFGDAQVLLKSEILREDMPSRILLERIENNSVPENFNGVWMFDQK